MPYKTIGPGPIKNIINRVNKQYEDGLISAVVNHALILNPANDTEITVWVNANEIAKMNPTDNVYKIHGPYTVRKLEKVVNDPANSKCRRVMMNQSGVYQNGEFVTTALVSYNPQLMGNDFELTQDGR